MKPVEVKRGDSPIVLGLPHTGIYLPEDVYARLTPMGQTLADTDWHIDRLYGGLLPDVTTVRATFHRYLIDANRDPSGRSLYPGQNTTGLVPLTDFDGEPLWLDPPSEEEVEERRLNYHAVYHAALQEELERIHRQHGSVILYDCHSIRSYIPFLFEGVLPDFNIGTNGGVTCAAEAESAVVNICEAAEGCSSITNGRFKGGWTTRHYGNPDAGFHAIQMELAQSTHLKSETAPFEYDSVKAENLRKILKSVLVALTEFATLKTEASHV
ncbi:MAG: N-formylglutamate deformylase [Rhizobiaceae bacterium]